MVNTPPSTGNAQLDRFLRSVADDLRTLAKPREGWRLSDFSADVSEVISDRRDLIDIVRAWGRIEDLEDSFADELKKHLDLYDSSLSLSEDLGGLAGTFADIQLWWNENPAPYLEDREKISNALSKAESALRNSQAATSAATSAESSASNAVSRVTALEAMAGLSTESPVDGQTANLLQQPDTLTRAAIDHRIDLSSPVVAQVENGYTGEVIREAIIKALTAYPRSGDKNRTVYLPAGDYLVSPRLFSDWDFNAIGLNNHARAGLRIVGDGKHATRLILQTGGEESWFYDSYDATTRHLFWDLVFEDMSLIADDPTKGNGFKQWSSGNDKRFRFINCRIDLYTVLHTLGTGNADLNRFINTGITARGPLLILENDQSVANGFLGCDITVNKSLVEIRSGGCVWVTHGNLEMHNYGDDTEDHYLIDAPAPVSNGQGSAEFNITDIRFEMHGINKKLARSVDSPGMLQLNFTRSSFGRAAGGEREVASVGSGTRLSFDTCILHDNFRFLSHTTLETAPMGAVILFDKCDTGRTNRLWERCTTSGDQARIISSGCFRQSSSVSTMVKHPDDFDMGWRTAPAMAPLPTKKLVVMKKRAQAIPHPGDNTTNLRAILPPDAYITKVYVRKPGLSGTTGDYQLHVGSYDMSIIYASSELVAMTEDIVMDLSDVGSAHESGIAIWATGSTTNRTSAGQTSMAYVEYI